MHLQGNTGWISAKDTPPRLEASQGCITVNMGVFLRSDSEVRSERLSDHSQGLFMEGITLHVSSTVVLPKTMLKDKSMILCPERMAAADLAPEKSLGDHEFNRNQSASRSGTTSFKSRLPFSSVPGVSSALNPQLHATGKSRRTTVVSCLDDQASTYSLSASNLRDAASPGLSQ